MDYIHLFTKKQQEIYYSNKKLFDIVFPILIVYFNVNEISIRNQLIIDFLFDQSYLVIKDYLKKKSYNIINKKYILDNVEKISLISEKKLCNIIEEKNETNFGHVNLVNRMKKPFPKRSDKIHISDVSGINYGYNSHGGSYYNVSENNNNTFYDKNKHISDEYDAGNIHPVDNIFELYRYSYNNIKPPRSTDQPSLTLSLFKPNINTLDAEWGGRYFISQLALVIAYNYYFPTGALRVYLDWYMLDAFKTFSSDKLHIEKLSESVFKISNDFETLFSNKYDISKLFNRFDKYIENTIEKIIFKNAFEKFMYYYVSASKIYNETQTDNDIENEQGGDFFVYKFKEGSDFTEIINEKICHISNGYIGQAMRYICLRQVDYNYNGNVIKRNKHYIWRDGHTNQIGYNDAQLIKTFNDSVKNSETKLFNLLPSNYKYQTEWHSKALCPADKNRFITRSAIAGIVQMANFTETSEWLSDKLYYNSIGMLFLIDTEDKVMIKYHREKGRAEYLKKDFKEYEYGIEEYIFNVFFMLDDFKNNNLYFQDRFISQIIGDNSYLNLAVPENTWFTLWFALWNILKYIKEKENIKQLTGFEIINKIENLRNDTTITGNTKKWLGFLLSILPTKYFISNTIFNKSANQDDIKSTLVKIDLEYNLNKLAEKYNIYKKNISDFTWDDLKEVGINCNTPIVTSGVEWCIEPYLKNTINCPPEDFFSGFYYENPSVLKYGIFRNPTELKELVKFVDKNKKIPLYKNIIQSLPEIEYRQKYLKYKQKYLELKKYF